MFHTLNAKRLFIRLGIVVGLTGLILTSGIMGISAQSAAGLGAASSFAVLGGLTVTNTGTSTIYGNVGVNPGSAVTGFPPGLVNGGAIHQADGLSLQAQNDLITAYNVVAGQAFSSDLTGQNLGNRSLNPGVYRFSSSAQLTGALVLNAQGNGGAVFIFQISSTLTTATGSSVNIINGGSACNVFWQVGSSATLGTTTRFLGNILAMTSITLNTGASISPGRALARNGAVTLDTNNISMGGCGSTSWASDNRVNANAAEVFASYCDAAAYRVILINENSMAGAQWTIPYATLIAAGPKGLTKDFGRYGVFSVNMDSNGNFYAALNGGLFHSNGQGNSAKAAKCTVPPGAAIAVTLPDTGYVTNDLAAIQAAAWPGVVPEKAMNTSRHLVLPSGQNLSIVQAYRNTNSWAVDGLRFSVGHLDGTSWLDDAGGNIVLVAHVNNRVGKPGPFATLSQVKTGDVFTLQDGTRQVGYQVISVSTVSPQDMQIIAQDGRQRLTMITCSDWDPSANTFKSRIVVVAVPS